MGLYMVRVARRGLCVCVGVRSGVRLHIHVYIIRHKMICAGVSFKHARSPVQKKPTLPGRHNGPGITVQA